MLTAYTAEGMLHIVYHRRRNRHIYSLGLLASPVTIATYFYETNPTRIAWSSSPSLNSKMIVPILQEELFSAPMMFKVSAMISLVQSFLRWTLHYNTAHIPKPRSLYLDTSNTATTTTTLVSIPFQKSRRIGWWSTALLESGTQWIARYSLLVTESIRSLFVCSVSDSKASCAELAMVTHRWACDLDWEIDFLVTPLREYYWGTFVLQDWLLSANDTVVRCNFLQCCRIFDSRCGEIRGWVWDIGKIRKAKKSASSDLLSKQDIGKLAMLANCGCEVPDELTCFASL